MNLDYAKELIEKTKKDFNLIAEEFNASRRKVWPEMTELKIFIEPNSKALDLGCGNGRLFEIFSAQGGSASGRKNIEYFGIDFSEELIKMAKNKYGNNFQVADILNLPFSDNYFDTIWSVAVFHHIPSRELRLLALKEMKRVLKDKGRVIMTCWNLYQKGYLNLLLKYFFCKIFNKSKLDFKDVFVPWGNSNIKRYYHAFTKKELEELFKESGLGIIESKFLRRNNKKTNILIVAEKL
jgi:ubiquinone/menaquinone biosynthesis C-methylase UbiE